MEILLLIIYKPNGCGKSSYLTMIPFKAANYTKILLYTPDKYSESTTMAHYQYSQNKYHQLQAGTEALHHIKHKTFFFKTALRWLDTPIKTNTLSCKFVILCPQRFVEIRLSHTCYNRCAALQPKFTPTKISSRIQTGRCKSETKADFQNRRNSQCIIIIIQLRMQ